MGLLDWDLRSGESRCSGVMAEIFGFDPGEYNPSYAGFLERVHPEDRERVRRTLKAAIAAGVPHELEFRIVRPDGGVRWVHSKGRVYQEASGELVRALGITLDITEQKRAEEERDRLHALEVATHAEAAERERISRELHDRVAHSMGVVHQSLQLYEALAEKDPGRAQARLHTAKETAKTALEQTRNLSMELRRSETEDGLVPALQDLLEVAVPDDVSAKLSVSGEEALLSGQQRGQLYLILREAVRNAVRHSGGSRISVGLDITPEEVSGYVEDDGCGLDGNGNGESQHGLGLQAIQERATLVGGWSRTYPVPEGGVGVEVRIPLYTQGGNVVEATNKIRVLLADDHAMFRQGISEMLSTDEQVDVVGEAEDGQEAIALAEKLRPDVVLLDVEMPVMGAREAMERMIDISPPPRVIIVTMYDNPRLVRELIGLGAVAYLVKSATIEELLSAVRTAAQSPTGPDENLVMIAPPGAFRDPGGADSLSERELEILLLVARGMSNYQVASNLHLSEATVKRHLANIYPKIGVSSRVEAVRKALQEQWITTREITDA